MRTKQLTIAVALALAVTSCGGDRQGWTIEGTIEGAADSTLYIEESTAREWAVIDSVTVGSDGTFAYTALQGAPDQNIYRVRMGQRSVCFPVDSTETVTLNTTLADFGSLYRLSGNNAAGAFAAADSIITVNVRALGAGKALQDSAMVSSLGQLILDDRSCLASYYILGRLVGGQPVFDASSKLKVNLMGAAAQHYSNLRPDDPRGKELYQRYLAGKQAQGRGARGVSMQANVGGLPDYDLTRTDPAGRSHNLGTVIDGAKVTVLNFTCMGSAASAANNMALSQVYNAYKNRGLQVYQIAFDGNEGVWRQTAAQLPWISVWNRPGEPMDVLMHYNVDPINGAPVSFVIDGNGDITERINDPAALDAAVKKALGVTPVEQ